MGLFGKKAVYCDICKRETGTPNDKKHKAKDGIICDICFKKCGYQQGMLCFADSLDLLKIRVNEIDNSNTIAEVYSFDTKVGGLEIDSVSQKWRVRMSKFKAMSFEMEKIETVCNIYDFSDVKSCEYIVDDEIVTTVKNNGVGRAVVGGALFGGAGAVVGAITAKDKLKEKVVNHGAYIRIGLSTGDVLNIPIFTGSAKLANTAQRMEMYGGQTEHIDEMLQQFEVMIGEQYSTEDSSRESKNTDPPTKVTNAAISNADEIRKFKQLLEEGIITQEEFDAKKKQLLGL